MSEVGTPVEQALAAVSFLSVVTLTNFQVNNCQWPANYVINVQMAHSGKTRLPAPVLRYEIN